MITCMIIYYKYSFHTLGGQIGAVFLILAHVCYSVTSNLHHNQNLSKDILNANTIFIHINAPSLLIAPPPPFSTFAKFIFRGFTSVSTATSLAILGFQKKMCLSTSPIEYRLREIKKITTKHGNFGRRRIKICEKRDKSL